MAKSIETLEKELREAERIGIQLEERLNHKRTEYQSVMKQLKELGVSSEADLKKMQEELDTMTKQLEELIPTDAIEEYKKLST